MIKVKIKYNAKNGKRLRETLYFFKGEDALDFIKQWEQKPIREVLYIGGFFVQSDAAMALRQVAESAQKGEIIDRTKRPKPITRVPQAQNA